MLSNNVGGLPGLDLFLQQQIMLLYFEQEHEQEQEDQDTIVYSISWLREPLSEPKADPGEPPPDVDTWTCPRCRSHRCIRVNPGNIEDPIFCCSVCGYTFHKDSAACLRALREEQWIASSTAPNPTGGRSKEPCEAVSSSARAKP